MLIILCGLIGSGKTTYAVENYKHFTDLDYMPPYSSKTDQIKLTLSLLERLDEHDAVCHITCYPTQEEIDAFRHINNKRFLWINASLNQAMENIMTRKRLRDMQNLKRVYDRNRQYLRAFSYSPINFTSVNVYSGRG